MGSSTGRGRSARPGARPPAVVDRVLCGRAFLRGRLQPVEIGIDETGTIVQVARSVRGRDRTDYGESVLVPSGVDLHVHLREPGGPEPADSLASGTLQAAHGGVGLVGDMPNNVPPTNSVERLGEKEERARGRIAVDLLLFAAASPGLPIARLASRAGAFKLYLSPTTGIDQTPEEAAIPPLLEEVAATGLPLSVHAEDVHRFTDTARPRTLEEWNLHRPVAAELSAIRRVLRGPPALRLHVAHVTSPEAARVVREAGHSFEVTPHHLLLSAGSSDDAQRKVNPPLRRDVDRRGLLEEFEAGRVPILASDHAPHWGAAKEVPFDGAPSGMPGLETMLPLLLERVRAGDLPLPVLQAATSDRPSRWVGVPGGRISVGEPAHLLVIDFRARTTLRASRLHAPCGWTAFEGWPAVVPTDHLRSGVPIVENGEFVGSPTGRVIRPEFAPRAVPATSSHAAERVK